MSSIISVLSVNHLLPELEKVLPDKKFHNVENAETDKIFRESEIIIADNNLIALYLYDLPNIKWIQGTWAGVERIMKVVRPGDPPKYPISRFTGKHFGVLMSEYVISQIISYERCAFEMRENQKLKKWIKYEKLRQYRSFPELTIGVLGVGNIGNRVAKTLNLMGAKILGYGRQQNFDLEQNKHISNYFTKSNLPQMLQNCDYLVNILPSTPETEGLLNGEILENCKSKGTVFINVGRGSIISEESLVTALKSKWISGAILDVLEKEPLPSSSALWELPNVVITPHVSAVSRNQDVAEQFKENLTYYEQKLPIPATINFFAGY
ncbi:unnamed protein product [Psylliodes chrysocephalus]|uniref:D-isomer specific 2-hydroxyacid dehydrogenase NAD-binding domain-containing protein n=1 Tax=Psylliodes chrysocephalus TaxID=3402493 RepID=A0A9P0G7R2_9CUCU|nr:unnamed protein product [Psylliodes chrysocephala]